jgi:diphthamide biosynthesis methyltransferase
MTNRVAVDFVDDIVGSIGVRTSGRIYGTSFTQGGMSTACRELDTVQGRFSKWLLRRNVEQSDLPLSRCSRGHSRLLSYGRLGPIHSVHLTSYPG